MKQNSKAGRDSLIVGRDWKQKIVINPVTAYAIISSIPIVMSFVDAISSNCEIVIQFQSDNYRRERIWISTEESGGKFELSIEGKPAFCLVALNSLLNSAKNHNNYEKQDDVFSVQVDEMRKWNIRTTFLDIFKPLEKVKINTTGSSYCKKRSIRQSYESGAKFSILIKGKPGFVQLASAQIRMNTPLLEVLSNVLLDCG